MDEPKKTAKTRRRFLADLLFVGGGLSAAALLAKSKFGSTVISPEPDIAGVVAIPEIDATPNCDPNLALPGEPVPPKPSETPAVHPPDIEGDVELPPPAQTPVKRPPAIKGKVAAPKPSEHGEI